MVCNGVNDTLMTHDEWLRDLNFRYSGIGSLRKYHWEFISEPHRYDKLINDPEYKKYLIEIMVRI